MTDTPKPADSSLAAPSLGPQPVNLEQLKDAARRLVALLDDPHPGLFTWVKLFSDTARALRDELFEDGDAYETELRATILQREGEIAQLRARAELAETTAGDSKWQNERLVSEVSRLRDLLEDFVTLATSPTTHDDQ